MIVRTPAMTHYCTAKLVWVKGTPMLRRIIAAYESNPVHYLLRRSDRALHVGGRGSAHDYRQMHANGHPEHAVGQR